MTDTPSDPAAGAKRAQAARIRRRYRAEKRFRAYGVTAIVIALTTLVLLIGSIVYRGHSAFVQTHIALDIRFDRSVIDPDGSRDPDRLRGANYTGIARSALQERFPDVTSRQDKRELYQLVSGDAGHRLREMVAADPSLIGTTRRVWFKSSADVDSFTKGQIPRNIPEAERRISDKQIAWLDALTADGALETRFNTTFFTAADSREPEQAGIWGAAVGSFFTLLVCLALSFPLGVMAAIYLEEFAPGNRFTDLIEININNLAAVPSIIFGLLGLAVLLNVFNLPRSVPLVGGIVLALMTLPTIIIASRAALAAVPPSIREGALGMGASPLQVVAHHVLPLAMPGILTGTIIGMAQALGETAPLLMIGMVAFIVDVPQTFADPATVLPVQIFLWADAPERAFVEKTSAAILVLLAFLVTMNLLAVILRKKFERRW